MGFEPDLKLTEEMLEVMDGKKSDTYRYRSTVLHCQKLSRVKTFASLQFCHHPRKFSNEILCVKARGGLNSFHTKSF